MVVAIGQGVQAGRSLKSLVNGFVLTKQTEGKSHRTVEFYSENLKRFLWYASRQGWSDDIRMVTAWHVREFLGYLANEKGRWGLEGNGSESFPGEGVAGHASPLFCGACELLRVGSP